MVLIVKSLAVLNSVVQSAVMIGVDRAKMRLYDLEDGAQINIVDSGQSKQDDQPVFDRGTFGSRLNLNEIKV
jgi:hypothetical protein